MRDELCLHTCALGWDGQSLEFHETDSSLLDILVGELATIFRSLAKSERLGDFRDALQRVQEL